MKFATKTILATFGISALCALGISFGAYRYVAHDDRDVFVGHYRAQTKIIAETLLQLDASSEIAAKNAAFALREIVHARGLPRDSELPALAHMLNVAHIFATDRAGKFIRSTNGDVQDYKSTLFDYCSGYRGLISGTSEFEQTPMVPASDEKDPGPFKYTMIPDIGRHHVLEVSVPLHFLGRTLGSALRADPNIKSLGLYSPNGTAIGQISIDGTAATSSVTLGKLALDRPTQMGNEMVFATRIAPNQVNCCECRTKNLAGDEKNFYYLLVARISTASLDSHIAAARKNILLLFVAALILACIAAYRISDVLLRRLGRIRHGVATITSSNSLLVKLAVEGNDEIATLGRQIDQMTGELRTSQIRLVEAERSAALSKLALQVAHDIRSPLAALNVAERELGSLPEDARILIRNAIGRIRDIANHLLASNRTKRLNLGGSNAQDMPQHFHIPTLLEKIIAEKRLEYRHLANSNIDLSQRAGSYAIFSKVDPVEFGRMISNLVNNSVEATLGQGQITLHLEPHANDLFIVIKDNGRGIPAEALSKIMEDGFSYAKPDGSGFGLTHARRACERWGGQITIRSKAGEGTEVRIRLPRCNCPGWFNECLNIASGTKIVILDHDNSIHQAWKHRFVGSRLKLINLSQAEHFREYVRDRGGKCNHLYLIDYDLGDSECNGIDLINELGITQNTILVTGDDLNESLLNSCLAIGITVIPKSIVAQIPISIGFNEDLKMDSAAVT